MIKTRVFSDDSIVKGRVDVGKSLREHPENPSPTTNLGAFSYFLQFQYSRDYEKKTLRVSQSACVGRLAQRFAVTTTGPTPASPTVELSTRQEEEEPCKQSCRELGGGLTWIAHATQSGMCNAVHKVARCAHDPSATLESCPQARRGSERHSREGDIVYEKYP